ncbi:cadherin-13-like isoform X2 [Petromyzon marinus]|uniref:Cadherin-1-like isoform X2 n=1 Tax=Petromyzon marinus TaxID=7757 RepID=A0AAJ7UBE1_PETMA|nr:cadherin-1-like isoform X2 [Petromyzon marinus]
MTPEGRAIVALCVASAAIGIAASSTPLAQASSGDGGCRPGFAMGHVCADIPERVPPGHAILTLPFRSCGGMPAPTFAVRPRSLRVTSRGVLVTSRPLTLAAGSELHVAVRARGIRGGRTRRSEAQILVRRHAQDGASSSRCPSRVRREWTAPNPHIDENDPGPYPVLVTVYTSDKQKAHKYMLTGPGADEDPVGLFYLDGHGRIYLKEAVDRETLNVYQMFVHAYDEQGQEVENPAKITVMVTDVNDETPQFVEKNFTGTVLENQPAGTTVMKIEATDGDDPATDHVIIIYTIISQKPPVPKAFTIDRSSGSITTLIKLDREAVSQFLLEVNARDCNGSPKGLSTTTTVTIIVGDTNDSPPEFTSPKYEGTVRENELVARAVVLDVRDADAPGLPAWRAVYTVTRGNEAGHFAIATDAKTNQGVLSVVKPLNFEAITPADKTVPLVVTVASEEPLQPGVVASSSSTATVLVHVTDVNEDAAFVPPVRVVQCDEGAPLGSPLGVFSVQDPDTGTPHNFIYKIVSDKAGWLEIDPRTGALSLAGNVDYEDPEYNRNGQYNVTVIAIDPGHPDFTCTGTVVLNIVDVNDHAPKLAGPLFATGASTPHLCLASPSEGLPLMAIDADSPAHGPPFIFQLVNKPPGIDELWEVVTLNATNARLQARGTPSGRAPLPGVHQLSVLVTDRDGLGEATQITVRACHCLGLLKGSGCVTPAGSVGLGFDGAAAIVFPILTLLLLGVLYCCFCRQPRPALKIPDVWAESLGQYNQEGGGQEATTLSSLVNNPDRDAPFTKHGGLSSP